MNLKENLYEFKKGLVRKALPLALAASLALGTPMGETKAKAYNLEEPSISYDDFKDYDYTIIFLGGRMMEFTNKTGHPYKKSKKVMVPVESICSSIYGVYNYDSKKETATIKRHGVTITFKKGSKKITVDDHGKKRTVKTKVANTIKKGVLYAQLSSVADAFNLTLKSDKKTGIINLNYAYDYENIDLKNNENNLVDLKKVKTKDFDKVMLDMVEIQPDYINVLKNTTQYKAFIEDKVLYIYSYQMIENVDYIYEKEKEYFKDYDSRTTDRKVSVTLENIYTSDDPDLDEAEFFADAVYCVRSSAPTEKSIDSETNNATITSRDIVKENRKMDYTYDMHMQVLEKADEIIEKVNKTSYTGVMRMKLILAYVKQSAKAGTGINAYDCAVKGDAKCTGFNHFLAIVLGRMGYYFVEVNGKSPRGVSHAWGYTYIEEENEWYLVDATLKNVAKVSEERTLKYLKDIYDGISTKAEKREEFARKLIMHTYSNK